MDLAAFLSSVVLLAAYQFLLHLRVQRNPLYTVHGVNVATREMWIHSMMTHSKAEVLAVQTLRNSVMASSFMASTAILLLIGTLSLSSGQYSSGLWHSLNAAGATSEAAVAVKLMCLVLDFFVAFFCFAMAVRFYNHVGYMVAIPDETNARGVSPEVATAYLNRAGMFYLIGIRSFFYSVPLVFWLFGPHFMIAATFVLIAALYPFDRAPRPKSAVAEKANKA